MANHKSAAKRAKQSIVRRNRNRSGKSTLKSALKKYRALLAENSPEAKDNLSAMAGLIDRSVKHGFIHKNRANRLKSKLSIQSAKVSAS